MSPSSNRPSPETARSLTARLSISARTGGRGCSSAPPGLQEYKSPSGPSTMADDPAAPAAREAWSAGATAIVSATAASRRPVGTVPPDPGRSPRPDPGRPLLECRAARWISGCADGVVTLESRDFRTGEDLDYGAQSFRSD